VFDKFKLKEPIRFFYKLCFFVLHWAGLQLREEEKNMLRNGFKFLQKRAREKMASRDVNLSMSLVDYRDVGSM
jgi:hypothetical protein